MDSSLPAVAGQASGARPDRRYGVNPREVAALSLAERIERYSVPEPNTGCVIWTGTITSAGYGQIKYRRSSYPAHRLAYEAEYGPVPDHLQIDHLCRNRWCVNPRHLEPVTASENVLRAVPFRAENLTPRAVRTECGKGHALTPENRRLQGDRVICRECDRAKKKREYQQNRERLNARSSARYAQRRDLLNRLMERFSEPACGEGEEPHA